MSELSKKIAELAKKGFNQAQAMLKTLKNKIVKLFTLLSTFFKEKVFRKKQTNKSKEMKKTKKEKRSPLKRRILFAVKILGGLTIASAIGVGIYIAVVISNTPKIDPSDIYSRLNENSYMYDDQGNTIDAFQSEGLRTNIKYKDMPKDLINAFIVIEDKTFWEHNGFNYIRLIGATWEGLTTGDHIQGTSTITQQLARNLYLQDTKSVRSLNRKIKEAYYTVVLEKYLSKEQIMEAYLNTIHLGSGANGVQAAAQTYFSKDVKDLTVSECATIAGITKYPAVYAPVIRIPNGEVSDFSDPNIIQTDSAYTTFFNTNESFKERHAYILKAMLNSKKINQETYDAAVAQDLKASIKLNNITSLGISTYFSDMAKTQVVKDLMEKYKLSEDDANNMLFNSGLKIYSTLNIEMQKNMEAQISDPANYPQVYGFRKDGNGNFIDSNGNIVMYDFYSYFHENGNMFLPNIEYLFDEAGNLILLKDKKLTFYTAEDGTISILLKDCYNYYDGVLYIHPGGSLLVPNEFKTLDSEGNVRISKDYLSRDTTIFREENGQLIIGNGGYILKEKVIQPQSAMVVTDYRNGHVKALSGGRSNSGRMLYNRASTPHPPGSSIKPLAVYSTALENGKTAATVFDDAPHNYNGKNWPTNYYYGNVQYFGLMTMREAIRESSNVVAVKSLIELGPEKAIQTLKNLGISTVVESGPNNDANAAALALGGMTVGTTPLDMASAYGAIANNGVLVPPTLYSKVLDRDGNAILEKTPEGKQVIKDSTAFILTDMMKTAVESGTGKNAQISGMPVAGKTGTTSNAYDAWFVGFTGYYVGSVWIGNDVQIELSEGSAASAELWSKVMTSAHNGLPWKGFSKPGSVVSSPVDTKSGKLPTELSARDPRNTVINEFFAVGTVPTEPDDKHVEVEIDKNTKFKATPWCPPEDRIKEVFVNRGYRPDPAVADIDFEVPEFFCNVHNQDVAQFPISDKVQLVPMATEHNISVTALVNGRIIPSVFKAKAGTEVTLTVTPITGFRLVEGSLTYNGLPVTGRSFIMPDGDVTITGTFEPGTAPRAGPVAYKNETVKPLSTSSLLYPTFPF